MSANKEATELPHGAKQLTERNKISMDLTKKKQLSTVIGRASELRVRSRFDSHTLSSLMKRKEPKKLTATSSSVKCAKDVPNRAAVNVLPGRNLHGICKKRNSLAKQSKSMQTLKMLFKRERNRRVSSDSTRNDELTKMLCQTKQRLEYSLFVFEDNLIVDVSQGLKKSAASPQMKNVSAGQAGGPASNCRQSAGHAENSVIRAKVKDGKLETEKSKSKPGRCSPRSVRDCSGNHSIVNAVPKIQLNTYEGENVKPNNCEIKILHRSSREPTEKSEEDLLFENSSDIDTQMYRRSQSANEANNRKPARKTWTTRKTNAQKEHADNDRTCHTNVQVVANSKLKKKAANGSQAKDTKPADDQPTKSTPQRNLVSANQRSWKPAGVNKISAGNTYLTQSTAHKTSFRSAGRFVAQARSKQTPNKCAE